MVRVLELDAVAVPSLTVTVQVISLSNWNGPDN